jgi:hypothetical protein
MVQVHGAHARQLAQATVASTGGAGGGPVDVGKHAAMALVCDFGELLARPCEFPMIWPGGAAGRSGQAATHGRVVGLVRVRGGGGRALPQPLPSTGAWPPTGSWSRSARPGWPPDGS